MRVEAELALVHQTLLRLVDELDRVLDREDVALEVFVEIIDHSSERRRFARARRTGDEDQSLFLVAELLKNRRHPELLERQDLGRNRTKYGAFALPLHENVDAEARDVAKLEREVDLERRLEGLPQGVVHEVVDHRVDLFLGQRFVFELLQVAVNAEHRRLAGTQVAVRGTLLDAEGK